MTSWGGLSAGSPSSADADADADAEAEANDTCGRLQTPLQLIVENPLQKNIYLNSKLSHSTEKTHKGKDQKGLGVITGVCGGGHHGCVWD